MRKESDLREFKKRIADRRGYRESFMSMYDLIKREGKREGKRECRAQGRTEGRAEGRADFALELFRGGVLTAAQARRMLRDYVSKGETPSEIAGATLKKIRAK